MQRLVPLAPISDPNLVISTIVQVLRLREARTRPIRDTLKRFLKEKQLLLLLDSFEQLLPAAPELADLLAACSRLKVLLTRRAPLHLSGEHQQMVFPLALPDLERPPMVGTLRQSAAVALFVARALAGLAGLAALAGSNADASRPFGAADALREATATSEIPTIRPDLDRDLAGVHAALGEQAFATAWAEGHAMSLEQAVEYALRGQARPDA